MASRGLGHDYGTGGSGAGGKIRRRPASRAAAASPYARPAPAAATAAASASQERGWFSRLITAGASRLLPSLFRKPPLQLAAPTPPLEPLDATNSRPEESLLLRQGIGPAFVQKQSELPNAPPSPPPPPLEDDLPEGEENCGAVANVLGAANSDEHSLLDLEDLLKQRTFKRSEFEYLSELLWSRTVGSNSSKPNLKKMHVSEKEMGSMRSNLPADFSIATFSVSDHVASPAEIAKAYMGSKSNNGSSLRLRLHDPSSLTMKSMEANTIQQARPLTIPIQGSRLHSSKNSDHYKSNVSTPNRSAIYKMSSSPYFKSAASSDDLFSTVSSSHRTLSSVHTFGRQVLKRKSIAVNNETVIVGPVCKIRQRYNRTSRLLETRLGYRGHHTSHGSKLNEDSEHSAQNKKRRCQSNVGDATLGGLDDKSHATSFGQAPVQSAEMAAKILNQLDTLVRSQKEGTPEIKQKLGNAMDVESHVPHKKEVSEQSNLSKPSTSGVKDNFLLNGTKDNVTFTPATVTEKSVDAASNTISPITSPKEKPPTFSLRSHPPNLVLSREVDRKKISITSNGFTFPVPDVLGAQSQAPPTPTMTSPPMLPVAKLQPSAAPSASITSLESGSRISKSVLEEGSIAQKCDKKMNADDQLMSSKSSGQVTSFTCNPVFKFANSELSTLNNGLQHASNSVVSDLRPASGSIGKASSPSAVSDAVLTNSASVSAQHISTGGGTSSSGTGSLSDVTGATVKSFLAPSLVSSGTGNSSGTFSFFPQFGTASSSATQDKSKAVSSSPPFNFSQQFGTGSSFVTQDRSRAVSPEPTIFSRNNHTQQGNSNNALFTQNSAHDSQSSANSAVVSPLSPISSPATGSGSTFSTSPAFGSKLTMSATGLPNNGSATPVSSTPGAVFSFTAATPSIPNSSPTTPIFGVSPATGSTTGIGQINGGNTSTDRKESPFSTILPFGTPSNSPPTPIFSSAATQFASTTSASPEVFKFGEQNASSGGFSLGTGGGNEKSGRKFIRVKRRK